MKADMLIRIMHAPWSSMLKRPENKVKLSKNQTSIQNITADGIPYFRYSHTACTESELHLVKYTSVKKPLFVEISFSSITESLSV